MFRNDEIAHLVTQFAHMGAGEIRLVAYGHISDYNPSSHLARAVLDDFSNVDLEGNIISQAQTPWFQLGSPSDGHQAAPTIGQQCVVAFTDKGTLSGAVVSITCNDVQPAVDSNLQPGEWTFKNKKSGTIIKFFNSGKIVVNAMNGTTFTFDENGGWTIDGQNHSVVSTDKDGNYSVNQYDGKQIAMPASGPMEFTGPGEASSQIMDPSGNVQINANQELTLTSGNGQNVTITLSAAGTQVESKGHVTIVSQQAITLQAPGTTITANGNELG